MNNGDELVNEEQLKTKIDIFQDGTISIAKIPPGFSVEVEKIDLTKPDAKRERPVDVIKDPGIELVNKIKSRGTEKFLYDSKARKLKEKAQVIDDLTKSS